MLKRILCATMVIALLASILSFADASHSVRASGTIYIRADGAVDPATAPLHREGNTYHFVEDISETIEVQKDNIVIDGKGCTLQRTGELCGFSLHDREFVTIKNVTITGFSNGIWLSRSRNNTISRNNITNNYNGISMTLFSFGNIIKDNNITNNDNFGISIMGDSHGNIIYHNNFVDNSYQQADSQLTNTWDKESAGNYWSDYTGADSNEDGIGDTLYTIPQGNQDRYPLMNPWTLTAEETSPPTADGTRAAPAFWTEWWFFTIIAVVIIASAGAVFVLRKRK